MYNRQILTFIQVVDSGSFAKASEKLFISTVSVMKQINALEAEIGVRLLLRTNQGIIPTPAGNSIYHDAKRIIHLSEQAVQHAREITEADKYVIRIGSSQLRPHNIMLEKWEEVDDGDLPFEIKIIPFSDDDIDLNAALNLLGKDFDCFVGPCDMVNWGGKYGMKIIKSGPYCLAVPRKHSLAQKKRLQWEDLCGEKIMLMKRGLFAQIDLLRDVIENEHPEIEIIDVPRTYNTSIFNECAKNNYLLGALDIWAGVHPSLLVIPVDWDNETQYGIIYEKEPPEKIKSFIDVISK